MIDALSSWLVIAMGNGSSLLSSTNQGIQRMIRLKHKSQIDRSQRRQCLQDTPVTSAFSFSLLDRAAFFDFSFISSPSVEPNLLLWHWFKLVRLQLDEDESLRSPAKLLGNLQLFWCVIKFWLENVSLFVRSSFSSICSDKLSPPHAHRNTEQRTFLEDDSNHQDLDPGRLTSFRLQSNSITTLFTRTDHILKRKHTVAWF